MRDCGANTCGIFQIHTAYEFLSDASKRSWYDLRYMYVQRRWTQYHMWEQREEQRGAKQEESERRQAEAEKVRVEEEARRNRFQEEAEAEPRRARFQHEANFTSQPDASAVTPCVHPHIGKVWWKNGKADCTFCRADETFCYVCPVCDVAACPDCRTDLPC